MESLDGLFAKWTTATLPKSKHDHGFPVLTTTRASRLTNARAAERLLAAAVPEGGDAASARLYLLLAAEA